MGAAWFWGRGGGGASADTGKCTSSDSTPDADRDGSTGSLKPYQVPHFSGPKTREELLGELKGSADPHVFFFDKKFERGRELLIFMEETKIWQDLLIDCAERAGVDAGMACIQLRTIVDERIRYHNSNFNAAVRPEHTPGIPEPYEVRVSSSRSTSSE